MTDQVNLNTALSEVVELNLEPVHLECSGVRRTVTASIDGWITSATLASREPKARYSPELDSNQYIVLSEMTASWSGITSTEK